MEKKYVKKLEEIVEKLKTADTREAFRILHHLQYGPFLENAVRSLVKKDLSLDQREASVLLAFVIPQDRTGLHVSHGHGFYCSWYNSKVANQVEKISIAIDCTSLKKVVMQIAHTEHKQTSGLNFADFAITPPAELKTIVDGLEGFFEQKPGLWIRSLGGIRNLAQAKRLIKPVWDVVYNAIAPFGEAW